MPLYIPSLTRTDADVQQGLSTLNVVASLPTNTLSAYATQSLAQSLELFIPVLPTPVTIIIDIAELIFLLVNIFNQPGRIELQKEAIERWFEPIFRLAMLNYCLPQIGAVWQIGDSSQVQAALTSRPDLQQLQGGFQQQAQLLVDANLGLQGLGTGTNQRVANQYLYNAWRHQWTTQEVIDLWQGILNAADVGPVPNGPPPPDGPLAIAAAGYALGAMLFHKYTEGHELSDADYHMFTDYYVQQGWNAEAGGGEFALPWSAVWGSYLPTSPPTIAQPTELYGPQPDGYFSPPCMRQGQLPAPQPQPQPQPPVLQPFPGLPPQPGPVLEIPPQPQPTPTPQPQPTPTPQQPTPYQLACDIWLTLKMGGDLTQEQLAWMADPAHYDALAEAMCDPECGYVPCEPQPPTPYEPQPVPVTPTQPEQPCPSPCQQQIDYLQQLLNSLPLQKLSELPDWERWIEQRLSDCCQQIQECCQQIQQCCELPAPQPQPEPTPQPIDCPPGCQDQITNLYDVVNNWPTQLQQYVNNFYNTTILPAVTNITNNFLKRCQAFTIPIYSLPCGTPLEQTQEEIDCGVQRYDIDWCCFGRSLWGKMAECWLDAHTPFDDELITYSDDTDPLQLVARISGIDGGGADERMEQLFADTITYLRGIEDEDTQYAPAIVWEGPDPEFIFEQV